jgi:hypothetical protein
MAGRAEGGQLHRLDLAFSRDSADTRKYVQQRLRERRARSTPGSKAARICTSAVPSRWARMCTRPCSTSCASRGGDGEAAADYLIRCSAPAATPGRVLMSRIILPVEDIKRGQRGLRGTLVESLADPVTGALREPTSS